MVEILKEIITIMTAGITQTATAIGGGLSTLVQSILLDTSEATTKLSVFGGVVMVFAGISLAIGLTKWAMHFISSFGRSK